MKNLKTKTLTAFLVTGVALMATACNTVKGVGQDLESAGDAAERAANDITD